MKKININIVKSRCRFQVLPMIDTFILKRSSLDCQYTHVLVWDAELKSQVRYLASDTERRRLPIESHAMKSWQKVQRIIRTSHAFHLHPTVVFPQLKC